MNSELNPRLPHQASARANLLAGLRNGRTSRAGSPAQQEQSSSPNGSLSPNTVARQMKANAPVFTPGTSGGIRQVTTPPADEPSGGNVQDYLGALETQLNALKLSAMQSTPSIAASYGATQGQPTQSPGATAHHHQLAANEEAVSQFFLQRQQQQQLLQLQLAHAQHLDKLRAQAAMAQAGQQHQAAQQQRFLFAQIQQEYEQQMRVKAVLEAQQERELQQLAAQEQRQAAQASIQASLRNRQVQKLYAQLLEEDEAGRLDPRFVAGRELWQVALDTVTEQHNQAQVVAATQEQIQQLQFQQYALHLQQLQQQQAAAQSETERVYRSDSQSPTLQRYGGPSGQQRERVPSSADQAVNWRSRTVSASPRDPLPGLVVAEADSSTESTPNESSPRSSRSFNSNSNSADETPQTSEEDIDVRSLLSAKASGPVNLKPRLSSSGSPSSTLSPAARGTQANLSRGGLRSSSTSASSTPRPRSSGGQDGSPSASTGVLVPVLPASRQPKGPPTDFASANFAARMNARTRKQALSKLKEIASASPRGISGAREVLTPVGCC